MSAIVQARRTRSEISVRNWRHNLRQMRAFLKPHVRFMAVIKADAYGHGLIPFGFAAQQEGVDWLGVALAEEGRCLREAGIKLPILVLGALNREGMLKAAHHGLTVTLADMGCLQRARWAAAQAGRTLDAHIKLDTGMHRIGFRQQAELDAMLESLRGNSTVQLTGVFTHLSDADNPDPAYTDMQLEAFESLCRNMPQGILRHASASSATLSRPDAHFDMVRPGICLYGCPPVETEVNLLPCLSLFGEVVFVKDVPAGTSIGYGRTHVTDKPTRVATIAAGYGDGYLRAFSGKARVLIRGVSCPVLGRVCMDQFMVDASQVADVGVGEDAVLLGHSGGESICAQELADYANTITYEVLLSPTARVPRHYDEAIGGA